LPKGGYKLIRRITLAAILLLAVAMVSGSVVDARGGRHALKGMAAGICTTLTDEQRAAIHEKVAEMREAGATREEIRTAVAEMLKEYGIEVPDEWLSSKGNGYYLCADLTDEQRAAIREKIAEMREAGATREEIRTAVAEMLKEYGVTVPEDWINHQGHGRHGTCGGLNLRVSMAPIADLAMIDAEIAAAPQASPQSGLSTTWGKIKVSR
jgi:DNA-binding transcriptional regulator YhcF (GntR family)